MNIPRDKDAKLVEAFRRLRNNDYFEEVMRWIRSERDCRDVENRRIGNAQPSEAQALSVIIDLSARASRPDEAGGNNSAGNVVDPAYEGAG